VKNVAKLLCVASGQSYGHQGSALFEDRRHFHHVIIGCELS